jgi:hypothetical protein
MLTLYDPVLAEPCTFRGRVRLRSGAADRLTAGSGLFTEAHRVHLADHFQTRFVIESEPRLIESCLEPDVEFDATRFPNAHHDSWPRSRGYAAWIARFVSRFGEGFRSIE